MAAGRRPTSGDENPLPPIFSPAQLLDFLRTHEPRGRCLAAYSGGMDSTVLLHALAVQRKHLPELCALHVNHGLSRHAAAWAAHCREQCHAMRIPLTVFELKTAPPPGVSLEAWARDQRYRAMAAVLRSDDVLLSAQHADDQVETLLLRLLRGSGPRGLAAMRAVRPLGLGRLLRPLLGYERAELRRYAGRHKLQWIEDESNAELRADRNYLRHHVLPLLRARWPGVSTSLRRACTLQAWAATLLDEQARRDLDSARSPHATSLALEKLRSLSGERLRNLLHYWLREQGCPAPTAQTTRRILRELLHGTGGSPRLKLGGASGAEELRRYRDRLYLVREHLECTVETRHWRLPEALRLPGGILTARRCHGMGLAAGKIPGDSLEVRTRGGGEKIRPVGRNCTRLLKKLWQEWGVPPWKRDTWPLLYVGDRLAAVSGRTVAEEFAAVSEEAAWDIAWQANEEGPAP